MKAGKPRFAGAASECTAALLVNPYDPEAVATSIAHALSMTLEERRTRHQALFQVISDNDLKSWGEHFLVALTNDAASPLRHEQLGVTPPALQRGLSPGGDRHVLSLPEIKSER